MGGAGFYPPSGVKIIQRPNPIPQRENQEKCAWAEPKLLLPDLWSVSSVGKGWRVRSSAELFSQ